MWWKTKFVSLDPIRILIWFSEQLTDRVKVAIVIFADVGKLRLRQYKEYAEIEVADKSSYCNWNPGLPIVFA